MQNFRASWRRYGTALAAAAIASLAGCSVAPGEHGNLDGANVLVFSKTRSFRHPSIPAGVLAFEALGAEHGFSVRASEDSALFNDRDLAAFDAIVFLSTTGDILNEAEQEAMERYIQAGGGFVGVHAAADTEHQGDWYWYRNLVGGVFAGHPAIQEARLNVIDSTHPSTSSLPEAFLRTDEWYDFRDLYEFRTDVLTIDEQSYEGGAHGDYHPMSWYHEYDGGRSFYTALGHTDAAFSDPLFRRHLAGGLAYAVGERRARDYTRARPEHDRFVRDRLVDGLDEPVAFDLLPDGSALVVQRAGTVLHVAAEGGAQEIGRIDIYFDWDDEFGLIGVAADPDFDANRWIYLMYNRLRENQLYQRVSRFVFEETGIDADSEVLVLEFPVDQTCCHTGGNIEFDAGGALFIATGDNTVPFQSRGYGPIDRREDRTHFDALRSAGNTNDLRGKILRIEPLPGGGYTVPAGNLFDDPAEGRPEIYAMGLRNPYTIAIDPVTGHLFYGDIGPDAGESDELRGARGYDEINRITGPGNFGWPLFIGDNGAYGDHDFASGVTGELFDPGVPVNDSPRNTGARMLPPARSALIWYPYAPSERFPELGQGGRNALVAGVYRQPVDASGSQPFPAYFEGRLFISDFMRDWIKVVDFDAGGGVRQIAPFMPDEEFAGILDLAFGDDGSLYILEYGRGWFAGNPEAGLSRLRYVGPGQPPARSGNRAVGVSGHGASGCHCHGGIEQRSGRRRADLRMAIGYGSRGAVARPFRCGFPKPAGTSSSSWPPTGMAPAPGRVRRSSSAMRPRKWNSPSRETGRFSGWNRVRWITAWRSSTPKTAASPAARSTTNVSASPWSSRPRRCPTAPSRRAANCWPKKTAAWPATRSRRPWSVPPTAMSPFAT